jgi:hypothetical protein
MEDVIHITGLQWRDWLIARVDGGTLILRESGKGKKNEGRSQCNGLRDRLTKYPLDRHFYSACAVVVKAKTKPPRKMTQSTGLATASLNLPYVIKPMRASDAAA